MGETARNAFAGPVFPGCYFHASRAQPRIKSMPRISDYMLDGIVFLYRTEDEARRRVKLGGTGFVLTIPLKGSEELTGHLLYVPYLVTNRHVVFGGGASVVSINRRDGAAPDVFPFEPTDWIEHPKGDDLAAISLFPFADTSIHMTAHIPHASLLTRKGFTELMIGVGDEVFMIGRFINHQGKHNNRPAVRFGSISMGVEDIWVKKDNRFQESIAVEMRSRTGFSGSPVAVYRMKNNILSREIPEEYSEFWALLGVNWGYILDEDGENTWLNGVVPSWKVRELFEVPALKDKQREIEEDFRAKYTQSSGSAAQSFADEAASDANPNHREDFNSLLGAAVRKRELKD
jgi:hypothetical protein